MSETKIFITGASGLVGLHMVQFLCQRNHQVIACIRATSQNHELLRITAARPESVEIVRAELHQQAKLAKLMSGCQVVVHAAASIEAAGKKRDLQKVNVAGTHSVLNAAIAAGIKHFIHISSLAVITGEKDRFGITEEEALQYCREAYANSKIDAEKIVMAESHYNRIAVTSMRPGFIYGPNERSWMPRLVNALRSRTAMLVGDGAKQTNVIYVENLCRAIELAMLNPTAFGQVYNLTDGEMITKRQLFDTICDGLNVPRVKVSIPIFLARILVEAASLIAPIAPPSLRDILSRYSRPAFRLVAINQGFDISKAERELNYIHRIPFFEGMSKTLSHWKQTAS